jgi:hypothetical protein
MAPSNYQPRVFTQQTGTRPLHKVRFDARLGLLVISTAALVGS